MKVFYNRLKSRGGIGVFVVVVVFFWGGGLYFYFSLDFKNQFYFDLNCC